MKVSLRQHLVTSIVVVPLLTIGCSSTPDLESPQGQREVGVGAARGELWREALFRFERAVAMDPQDAMAHNNLAVAYEANGEFEKAREAYTEALRLDRSNQYIQKNYSRFVEFYSRNQKREKKAEELSSARAADEEAPQELEAAAPDAPVVPPPPPEVAADAPADAPGEVPPTTTDPSLPDTPPNGGLR